MLHLPSLLKSLKRLKQNRFLQVAYTIIQMSLDKEFQKEMEG